MQLTPLHKEKKSSLFVYLLALTALFILIEISFFIQSNEAYLGDFKLVSDRLTIPMRVLPDILKFLTLELVFHLLFALTIWGCARLIGAVWQLSWKTIEKLGFGLWIVSLTAILLENQIYFPNSKFSELTQTLVSLNVAKTLFIFCVLLLVLAALALLVGTFRLFPRRGVIVSAFVILGWGVSGSLSNGIAHDASTQDKPNIILIGVDSLRPDFLGYFGYEKITPYLDEFLTQATVFSNSLTPIARTFPAWVSILTGQYPKTSGVRFNLPETSGYDWQNNLPVILQKNGYETIYATDETRFSNIDKQFGFDKIITPPVGFNDFLLGTLNDFPISNLLVNTWIGRYLFPFSYGNRPAVVTYNPNSFLKLFESSLPGLRTKPVFISVHLCLPHYPYIWKSKPFNNDRTVSNYQASVHRVDQQVHELFKVLARNNLLHHSVIILLSDHGEAMGLDGDRITEAELFVPGSKNTSKMAPVFYPSGEEVEPINRSAGHGTDILSLTQYHNVLAFRFYGTTNMPKSKVISSQVSLLDIKPTILKFLKIPGVQMDGHSLLEHLQKAKIEEGPHDFFMETDFSPQAIRSVHPETRKLLFEGINFFQVDPKTTRLTVKKQMGQLIISSKQFADVYDNWILALYPQNNLKMIPILVNLKTGEWTDDLSTPFALASPAQHMLSALRNFYGKDLQHSQNKS